MSDYECWERSIFKTIRPNEDEAAVVDRISALGDRLNSLMNTELMMEHPELKEIPGLKQLQEKYARDCWVAFEMLCGGGGGANTSTSNTDKGHQLQQPDLGPSQEIWEPCAIAHPAYPKTWLWPGPSQEIWRPCAIAHPAHPKSRSWLDRISAFGDRLNRLMNTELMMEHPKLKKIHGLKQLQEKYARDCWVAFEMLCGANTSTSNTDKGHQLQQPENDMDSTVGEEGVSSVGNEVADETTVTPAYPDNDEISITVEDDETGDASANPRFMTVVTEMWKHLIQANAFTNDKKNQVLMLNLSLASLAFSMHFLPVGKVSEAGDWIPGAASLVGVISSWKSLNTTRKWVRAIGMKIATASISTAICFFAVNKFLDLPKDIEILASTGISIITSATMCWL